MSTNTKQISRAQKKLDKYEKKLNITKNKLSNLEDKSSKSIISAEKNKHKGVFFMKTKSNTKLTISS